MTSPNWTNRTMSTDDNLNIMRGMTAKPVELNYRAPPFNPHRNYAAPLGSGSVGAAFNHT